ncbi:hypothetical protein [Alkaliphilus transvaalensis]|nr:hypothetical protein [Alkaliphilus transvaalensis]
MSFRKKLYNVYKEQVSRALIAAIGAVSLTEGVAFGELNFHWQ